MAALPSIAKGAKDLVNSTQSHFQASGVSPKQIKTAYNQTQEGIKQQQDFVNALQAQNGLGNQADVFHQQQQLADQLQNVANGTGPNPAMAALNQATGQNVANQNALMAGQRGASANTGLIARQAAQQGAQTQQNAVGQGAQLMANQQLAGMNALQQQQGMMGNMASNQVAQQQGGINALNQNSLGQQSNLLGLQGNVNNNNANIAMANQDAKNQMIGNLLNAGGTAAMMMAGGGEVAKGPRSNAGKHIHGYAQGGKVPALVSPGEVYLKPQDVKQVAEGNKAPMAGEKIPGKAKVQGAKNDYANDTVRKDLDQGGIILPRSITQAKDSDRKAIEFVQAILSKHAKSLPKK